MRSMIAGGTTTPGTSFARNSALRSETSGQIPATIPSPTGAPLFYFIRYGDSHVGETRSNLIFDQLRFALPAFNVPERH